MICLRHKSKCLNDLNNLHNIETCKNIKQFKTIKKVENILKKNDLRIYDNIYLKATEPKMSVLENHLKDAVCFKLINNSKNPKHSWKLKQYHIKHNEIVNAYDECNESLGTKKYKSNYGILCGNQTYSKGTKKTITHNNGITIVDIDFLKTKYQGKIDYFFKGSFCETFGDRDEFIKLFDTATIETAGGGLHLIFQYEEELKSKVNQKHHIDILNDNVYVVGFKSIVDNKEYKVINDVLPKKMNEKLMKWIKNNLYEPHSKIVKQKPIYPKKIKMMKQNDFVYDIEKEELIKILNTLPKCYNNDYKKWSIVTAFCKVFKIKDVWDKYSKGNKLKYDKENNEKLWDNITDIEFCNNSVQHIFNKCNHIEIEDDEEVVEISYPSLHYIKYKQYTDKKIKDADYVIDRKKLGYTIFYDDEVIDNTEINNFVVKADTGTGKTTSFKHYAKILDERDDKYISLVSRVSLGAEQYEVFSNFGLRASFYKKTDKFDSKKDNVVIQVDSITKLYRYINENRGKYVLFMDEFNSLVEYAMTSDTLNKRRVVVYKFLKTMMQNAKQIIMVDADISYISHIYLKQIGIEYKYIVNQYKHSNGVIAEEIKDVNELIEKLRKEKKFILCCDSKTNAEKVYTELTCDKVYVKRNGRIECDYIPKENPPKIILITKDTTKHYCLDDFDMIIFSPKIIYGLDSNNERPVYCWYKGDTITPPNMLQQIARERQITKINFLFEKKIRNPKYKNRAECKEILKIGRQYVMDEFDIMCSKKYREDYLDILTDIEYKNDCYNTNKFAWFLKLLKNKGIVIKEKYFIGKKELSKAESCGISKRRKKVLDDNFSVVNENYSRIIQEYLKLPYDIVSELRQGMHKNTLMYKCITDPYALKTHFDMCNFLFKEDVKLTREIKKCEEFNVNKVKSSKMKIRFLNEFLSKTYPKDIINATKPLSVDESLEMNKQYKTIFRNRCKKNADFTKLGDVTKYIGKMIKQIDPSIILSKQRVMRKGENINIYEINEDYIKMNEELYEYRQGNYIRNEDEIVDVCESDDESDDEEDEIITPIKM